MKLPTKTFHIIIQADVRQGLTKLLSESVDCVVTSPPYWGLRDYKIEPVVWDGMEGCEHTWGEEETFIHQGGNPTGTTAQVGATKSGIQKPRGTHQFCSKCSAWKGQLGLEPKPFSRYDGLPVHPVRLRESLSEQEQDYVLKEMKRLGIDAKTI